MFKLCIAEAYYLDGFFRVEDFKKESALLEAMKRQEPGTTCWRFGDPVPKRSRRFYFIDMGEPVKTA